MPGKWIRPDIPYKARAKQIDPNKSITYDNIGGLQSCKLPLQPGATHDSGQHDAAKLRDP